jgi:hypothetical protein
VEWCAWRPAPMQCQRRNDGVVVAVGLGKAPDGASEDVRRRNIGRFCLCRPGHVDNPSVASAVSPHCRFFYFEPFSLAVAQLAYEGNEGPEVAYRIEHVGKT